MKIKVVKEIECCSECPFREKVLQGPDYCSHPSLPNIFDARNIIDSNVDVCFPKLCPLLKGKVLKQYNKEKKSQAVLKSKLGKLWK